MPHLFAINGIVHDGHPTFESGNLKQAQVRFSHVVKVHRGVIPRVVFVLARRSIRDDFVIHVSLVLIHALQSYQEELSPRQDKTLRGFSLGLFEGKCVSEQLSKTRTDGHTC